MAYSGVYVFGDSLVDAGNALKLAQWYDGLPLSDLPEGAPTSSLGYFQGRFSDGYNFADLVANKTIGMVTKPIFPYFFEDPWLGIKIAPFASDPNGINLNFAYGGAQIRQGNEVVPDLDGQTDAFRHAVDGDADPGALYLITMGGNDVRSLVPSGSAPASQAAAHAALDAAAAKMLTELSQLIEIGAENILITGVPDVGLIPKYDVDGNLVLDAAEQLRSAAATEYSIYLDTLIRTEVVPALEALGATVTYVPLMDYVDANGNTVTGALNANLPTLAALHGLTADELSGNLLNYQNLLFFDDVHPNAQANALLGAYMYAQLTGTPWIETLPLTGAEVDYRMTASIATPGEVDKVVVALVAGTTYTLEMLGMSALGTAGSLADPSLRLLGPNGSVAGFNADSGVGFDATLTFTAATTGTYTLELSSTGVPTGVYALQAAAVGGAATLAGNTYTVTNAATVILEGAGGVGQDVVKAGVSYVLNAGAEIEVLRTTNDRGKTAIDLTGNDFSQTIVGNAAGNRIEGKGGADVLTGGGGNDVFVLGNYALTNAAQIDSISDYAKGDVVDITQVLSVGAGTNVVAGGYLRVTTSGLVQVDLNGGGSEWVTLSTINGNGAVAVRYVSGGTVTNVSVSRVAANTNIALAGVVAAAGLTAVPAAAESFDQQGFVGVANFSAADSGIGPLPSATLLMRSALADEIGESLDGGAAAQSLNLARDAAWNGADSNAFAASNTASSIALTPLLQGTVAPAQSHGDAHALVAQAVAMPSAEMIMPALEGVAASALDAAAGPKATGEVARVIAEALSGGGNDAVIDALLDALPGQGHGAEALASLAAGHGFADAGHFGMHALAKAAFAVEALAVHADLPLQA